MSETLDKAIERYVAACQSVNARETIETAAEMVAAWLVLKAAGHAAFGKAAETVVFSLVRSRFGVEGMNALSTAFRRPAVRALIEMANNTPNPIGGSDHGEGGGARDRRRGVSIRPR